MSADAANLSSRYPHPESGAESPPRAPAERRTSGPRRVRSGLRLRSRDGVAARSPLAQRWVNLIEVGTAPDELAEGLRYARIGQIVRLEIEPGSLVAAVQGTALKPYTTRLIVGAFSPRQWESIIEAMAQEALFLIKLLARELPEELETVLAGRGLALLPRRLEPVRMECTCGRPARCRHAMAAGYLFAEQLASDPLQILAMRGMSGERLLDRLRQARAIEARGVAAAHRDPIIPESEVEPLPLEDCIETFWRSGPQLNELQAAPPPQHISHALLRRLGPSPLQGKFPLVGLLASVYDTVAEHAVRLRDRAERIDDHAGDDPPDQR